MCVQCMQVAAHLCIIMRENILSLGGSVSLGHF